MKILVASNDVSCLVDILKERPILTPKLDPKSVQKWSQVGSKTVFKRDQNLSQNMAGMEADYPPVSHLNRRVEWP